jgi:hypothetical protein
VAGWRNRFQLPDWFVRDMKTEKGAARPASRTDLHAGLNLWFRLEYVPPTAAECAGLPHAEMIQSRPLRSRAFSPATDRID